MGDQGVDQRAVQIAGRRMDHQPGRLVDNDQRIVLIDDRQRNILALRFGRGRRRHGDRIDLARFDSVIGVSYRPGRARDRAGRDQRLKARAAKIVQFRGQEAVQPPAVFAGAGFGPAQRSAHGGSLSV